MGPGYLPLVLGVVLAGLGLVILGQVLFARLRASPAVSATAAGDQRVEPAADTTETDVVRGPTPWGRAGLLAAAVLVFGLLVDGAGLVPALFLTAFLASLAGRGTRPVRAVLIAAGLTLVCVVVFVFGLQLRLPLLGTWFR